MERGLTSMAGREIGGDRPAFAFLGAGARRWGSHVGVGRKPGACGQGRFFAGGAEHQRGMGCAATETGWRRDVIRVKERSGSVRVSRV